MKTLKPASMVDTQKKVAKIFGVTVRCVQQWAAEGMPKTRNNLYDIAEIQNWRFLRLNRKKNKSVQSIDWDQECKKIRANIMKLRYEEMKKNLLPLSVIEDRLVQTILVVKQAMLSLPGRIAPLLVGKDACEAKEILRERITEVVKEFAESRIAINPRWTKKEFMEQTRELGIYVKEHNRKQGTKQ